MGSLRLFLCGDVMLGRGIDQALPHPGEPVLHEEYVKSAETYVHLAERANGPIPRPVSFEYAWGDALAELEKLSPALRIVNLETSITTSSNFAQKGINYRMHPANSAVLTSAGIDCCALANNHVMDFGEEGLGETIAILDAFGICHAGAGHDFAAAAMPAILATHAGRVLVFSFGFENSGIPAEWAAGIAHPGVHLISEDDPDTWRHVARLAEAVARKGDILVASLHWGGNWGYAVTAAQRAFAHRLIEFGFALVHGHSSHHPKAIEVYHDRLILYGCGDFITDYEGIEGYGQFRSDLSVLYLPDLMADGALQTLRLVPFRFRRFRLEYAGREDAQWLAGRLERESAPFGAHIVCQEDLSCLLRW